MFTSHTFASSPDAWQEHRAMVTASCINASHLKAAKPVVSAPVEFPDEIGYTALLLQGSYPQSHMKNRKGRELCLFDKKTQKAYISEADGYK
ncbi:hypothetical protein [Collimonas antrihumi]|uniref:hypothetical protein n=1 Tax=Collimonas antrihumi TaxID=1940615 RepID=UPI001B8D92F8|nr:hypothetical protein [Collimonas antrihumi]